MPLHTYIQGHLSPCVSTAVEGLPLIDYWICLYEWNRQVITIQDICDKLQNWSCLTSSELVVLISTWGYAGVCEHTEHKLDRPNMKNRKISTKVLKVRETRGNSTNIRFCLCSCRPYVIRNQRNFPKVKVMTTDIVWYLIIKENNCTVKEKRKVWTVLNDIRNCTKQVNHQSTTPTHSATVTTWINRIFCWKIGRQKLD